MTDIISAYHNPRHGLISASKLALKLKSNKEKVHEALKNQEEYQINKSYKYNPKDNIPIMSNPRSYQADLMFFDKLSKKNNGYTCLLTIINTTTRKAYVYPLKTKEKKEVATAFEKFLQEIHGKIAILTTDNGTEFKNDIMNKICEKNNIRRYYGDPDDHRITGRVERFNRTLRTLIDRYMESHQTTKYIDVLPDLVANYNETPNASLHNDTPDGIKDLTVVRVLMDEKKRLDKLQPKINQFNIGDQVRHLEKKNMFEKGTIKYSREVKPIIEKSGYSYFLEGDKAPYRFYQLDKVANVQRFDKPVAVEKKPLKEQKQELKTEHNVKKELNQIDSTADTIRTGTRSSRGHWLLKS